jgi:AraC family transcriptional regulator
MLNNPNPYSERIQRVVDYVAEHLDEELDLETVAGVACFSPYHFHRIYRGLFGETLNETVRRLRLHRAAIDLLDREMDIERTARRAGYASQAAFTRAFRAEYGEPPAHYRGIRREARTDERSPAAYRVETVNLPRLRLAMIEHRGDYQLTGKVFERLIMFAATTGLLRPDTRVIGIYQDDPESVPQAELRSAACITVPNDWAPSGELKEGHVEGGQYAKIIHTGPYTELKTAYDWLYQTWLPISGEELRNLPCLEEYLNNPRQVPAKDLETAVLIPLAGESQSSNEKGRS